MALPSMTSPSIVGSIPNPIASLQGTSFTPQSNPTPSKSMDYMHSNFSPEIFNGKTTSQQIASGEIPSKQVSTEAASISQGKPQHPDTSPTEGFLYKAIAPFEQTANNVTGALKDTAEMYKNKAQDISQWGQDTAKKPGLEALGGSVKDTYPGSYDSIDDVELGKMMLDKHPEYQSYVDSKSGIMGTAAKVLGGIGSMIVGAPGQITQGTVNLGEGAGKIASAENPQEIAQGATQAGLGATQAAFGLATPAMPISSAVMGGIGGTDIGGKVLGGVSNVGGEVFQKGASMLGADQNTQNYAKQLGENIAPLIALKGVSKAGESIAPKVMPAVNNVGGKLGEVAKGIAPTLKESISSIPEQVKNTGEGMKNVITRDIPVGIMERDISLTPTERANIESINGKPAGAVALEYNLPKDKQSMADALSVKADEAYNGITNDLKNIPERSASAPAKEMLGIMLDEMGQSAILKRTMKPYMEKLQQMVQQPDFSLSEKNAIRRDFDRIVANKIFDSKGRVSNMEDKSIANIRQGLSDQIQNEAMKHGIDIKNKNDILRTSVALRDGVLRRLSQENKNNKIGIQDMGVGAILGAGDPLTTASVIFGKKVLEKNAPTIAQKLYNSNKTPYATSNMKRGVNIPTRDTTNGLSITPDNGTNLGVPLALPAPSGKSLSAKAVNVNPIIMGSKSTNAETRQVGMRPGTSKIEQKVEESQKLLPSPKIPKGTALPISDVVSESMRNTNSKRPEYDSKQQMIKPTKK